MFERLSFYIPRTSVLHNLNPLTKLTLVFALILIAFSSPFYWLTTLLIVGVVVPLAFLGKVQRPFFWAVLRLVVPAIIFIYVMQSLFLPGGHTVLFSFWFLSVTREAAASAYLTASRIFLMVSSFIIFLLTTHPSQLMSDLTRRGLPGQFAYVIISTLQIIPQMQAKAQTIIAAQRSRGLDTQSTFAKRVGSLVPLVGPLVFGSLVEVEERAIAIEARGFTSKTPKTRLYELPDPALEKNLRWALVVLVILSFASKIWLR
jgi:energy-coupling factor transport system permease protein